MNRSTSYSPLEMSRRWIKSPRQRASTSSSSSPTAAVRNTRKSFKSTAQSLLSRITITCSPDKNTAPRHCYEDEAETPIIYWADEKYSTNNVKKKTDKFVDPFELKPVDVEQNNLGASSSVSFEIVGTISCIRPTLDTIPENEQQQQQASVDPFETTTYAAGQENGFEASSSPTSIVGSFDYSENVTPMRLFPGNDDDIGDAFNMTCNDEEGDFETFPFEGVNFEEDNFDTNMSGTATDVADDESLEVWVESVSTMNGFIKTEDFQSQDWDDEAE